MSNEVQSSERPAGRASFRLAAASCALTMAFVLPSRGTNAQGAYKPQSTAQEAGMIDVSPPADAAPLDITVSHGRLLRFDGAVDSVFVADPAIADVRVVTPDVVYVFGKKLGTTNIIAIAPAPAGQASPNALKGESQPPKLKAALPLRVVANAQLPKEANQALQPTTTTDITIFGQRAVATGHTRNIDEAVDVATVAQTFTAPGQTPINNTTIGGSQQVNIRVRFAEVSKNDLQSFGVDWQLFNAGNIAFGYVNNGAAANANAGIGIKAGAFSANVLIEALQRNGALNVLAEPNLSAVTGQTASFLAGGEVPVPVPQAQNVVTVQYKSFGVSLLFTPTLIKRNRISLHVRPEVSMVSTSTAVRNNGYEMPSFTVRRAETTVEMASGQTFAIGGLFQRQVSKDIDKFPVLGDVPVLGALFQSERFRRNETELVILITPYLVRPVRERDLATPLDAPAGSSEDDDPPPVVAKAKSAKKGPPSKKKEPDPDFGLVFK